MKKNQQGFTMIELAVVIAIIAIATAISTPWFIQYRNNAKLREGVFGLKANLGKARSLAVRDRSDVLVQLSADEYQIGTLNPSSLPSGVRINLASTSLAGDNITFSSKGLPKSSVNDTGNILIENDAGDSRTITINRLGRITIN